MKLGAGEPWLLIQDQAALDYCAPLTPVSPTPGLFAFTALAALEVAISATAFSVNGLSLARAWQDGESCGDFPLSSPTEG